MIYPQIAMTNEDCGNIAIHATFLSPEVRYQYAINGLAEQCGEAALVIPNLTPKQVLVLAGKAPEMWRYQIAMTRACLSAEDRLSITLGARYKGFLALNGFKYFNKKQLEQLASQSEDYYKWAIQQKMTANGLQ